jgi:hypothetical protein
LKVSKKEIINAKEIYIPGCLYGGVMVSLYLRQGLSGFQERFYMGTAADINLTKVREAVGVPLRYQRGVIAKPGDYIQMRVRNGSKPSEMFDIEGSCLELYCSVKTDGVSSPSSIYCISSSAGSPFVTWSSSTMPGCEEEVFGYYVPAGYYMIFNPSDEKNYISGCLMSQDHEEIMRAAEAIKRERKLKEEAERKSPIRVEIIEK